jgi:hypothetical protein
MIGYKNVDEHKLLRLFCSKESLSAMPLLKDNKVFATDGHKAIYVNAEVCQGEYEKTKRFNIELPPEEQELNIPLLSLQKAYDSLPKVETEEYDSEDCDECNGTGSVVWEYLDEKGHTHCNDFDCPICDGFGFFKRNIRKCYEPEWNAVIKLDGFFINNNHIKAIIDALLLLGKDHITLLSIAEEDSVVYAYFRIDENITIVISPYCDYDEEDADAKVEL